MRIESIVVEHDGRVNLFYEGGDVSSDYCPMSGGLSQRLARQFIARSGTLPSCAVAPDNYRDAGQPLPAETRSARRFAASVGLAFRDRVRFPVRATAEEAEADRALEPDATTVVVHVGRNWIGDRVVDGCYRAILRGAHRGEQVVSVRRTA